MNNVKSIAVGTDVSEEVIMASKRGRKYSKKASRTVAKTVHQWKRGELHSGRSGKTVRSRKQAIAIGLSEARRAGDKVPATPATRRSKRKSSQ
jgi:hypothetical protein